MSKLTRIAGGFTFVRRLVAPWMLAASCVGLAAAAVAQDAPDKTVGERIREYWSKVVAKTESSAQSAGDEYHKLRDRAAHATGPAREKMAAELDTLSRKWAIAREKMATTVELHMNALHEEYKTLEGKAHESSGPAREKMNAEMHKLHEEWTDAREKMEKTLSSNLQSSRDELEHLKEHAKTATDDAKAKLRPRMERLKAEFHKDREKLGEYLESDMKRTKEDMEKIEHSASQAAKATGEKLSAKYHELKAKLEQLHKENLADEEK